MNPDHDLSARLAEAHRTIEQQARELDRLRAQQGDGALADRLRSLLELTAAAGVVAVRAVTAKPGGAIVEVSPCDIQTLSSGSSPESSRPPAAWTCSGVPPYSAAPVRSMMRHGGSIASRLRTTSPRLR